MKRHIYFFIFMLWFVDIFAGNFSSYFKKQQGLNDQEEDVVECENTLNQSSYKEMQEKITKARKIIAQIEKIIEDELQLLDMELKNGSDSQH